MAGLLKNESFLPGWQELLRQRCAICNLSVQAAGAARDKNVGQGNTWTVMPCCNDKIVHYPEQFFAIAQEMCPLPSGVISRHPFPCFF
jgi:hypothetical protein